MTKEERKAKFEKFKPYIQVGITALVEFFTGAVINTVVSHVDGGKIAKYGAKAGGALVGLKVGSDVTDYICDGIEGFLDDMDEFKEAIDENNKEATA